MKALRNISFAAFACSLVAVLSPAKTVAAELIMLEQKGCHWCAVWNDEIGIAYPKTEEGRRAPLRRVDIHEQLPEDLKSLRKASFTPTFVVWHNGREIDRLRGYPGSHFFWPMLGDMLSKLDKADVAATSEPKS